MSRVLDASALIAYIHQEPGWDKVRANIAVSLIGAVNWCEVAQKIGSRGFSPHKTRALLTELGLAIVPFSADQAEGAASLWEATRRYGLSLADRACLALAMERNVPVMTADREWSKLDLQVEIQLVR